MLKQPGHLTSMKKDRGAGTRVYGVRNIMLADFVRVAGMICRGLVHLVSPFPCVRGPQGVCSVANSAGVAETYLELMLASLRRMRRIQ